MDITEIDFQLSGVLPANEAYHKIRNILNHVTEPFVFFTNSKTPCGEMRTIHQLHMHYSLTPAILLSDQVTEMLLDQNSWFHKVLSHHPLPFQSFVGFEHESKKRIHVVSLSKLSAFVNEWIGADGRFK